MSVLRKYNPTTEQWEILQGGVQGLQGPPASLSKGTVTTGAPGTDADFTVTGTPPNQTLSLTIPRGEVGPAGGPIPEGGTPGQFPTPDGAGGYAWSDIATTTYLIVGPGRPDTPATTGGIITGSEPVGAEYRSTDGANVGAWVWMKRPGGKWEVTDGDTGSRTVDLVDGELITYGAGGSYIVLARESTTVYLSVRNIAGKGVTAWQKNIPAGFLPSLEYNGPLLMGEGSGLLRVLVMTNGRFRISGSGASSQMNGLFVWKTSDPWPTTLPGTPA